MSLMAPFFRSPVFVNPFQARGTARVPALEACSQRRFALAEKVACRSGLILGASALHTCFRTAPCAQSQFVTPLLLQDVAANFGIPASSSVVRVPPGLCVSFGAQVCRPGGCCPSPWCVRIRGTSSCRRPPSPPLPQRWSGMGLDVAYRPRPFVYGPVPSGCAPAPAVPYAPPDCLRSCVEGPPRVLCIHVCLAA